MTGEGVAEAMIQAVAAAGAVTKQEVEEAEDQMLTD